LIFFLKIISKEDLFMKSLCIIAAFLSLTSITYAGSGYIMNCEGDRYKLEANGEREWLSGLGNIRDFGRFESASYTDSYTKLSNGTVVSGGIYNDKSGAKVEHQSLLNINFKPRKLSSKRVSYEGSLVVNGKIVDEISGEINVAKNESKAIDYKFYDEIDREVYEGTCQILRK
jgi:hypothetical protein